VGDATLDALLTAPAQRAPGGWRFCRNPMCAAVYFHGQDGAILGKDALSVRVGQKDRAADRPICYCFDHSAEELVQRPSIADDIKAACRRGEDRCAQTNPQGSCCLGNVAAVLKTAAQEVSA